MSAAQDKRDSMDATPHRSQLSDELTKWRRALELDLRVSAPAHVVSFNAVTETVDVLLGHLPVAYIEGQEIPQAPIAIPGVPVVFPGSNTSGMTFNIRPGDTGLCVFSDRCMQTWNQAKAPGIPVDPVNGRTHNLADAVFLPGLPQLLSPRVPPVNPLATTITGPLVALGATAVDFGVKGTTLAAALAPLSTTLTSVPAATDLATALVLANANKTAILATMAAIIAAVSTKVMLA